MAKTLNEFQAMLEVATDDDWLAQQNQSHADAGFRDGEVDPSIYLACFGTPAGRMVLEDLFKRYCSGTRFVPGEAPEFGFFREGSALVVYEILATCAEGSFGETVEDRKAST